MDILDPSQSRFVIETRAPHVLEVISTGYGNASSIALLEKAVYAALSRLPAGSQHLHLFWDTTGLESYEPAFRQRTITLIRDLQRRKCLLSVQAYVQSKIVQMGAQVASMLLSMEIECYNQELAYRGALRAAIAERGIK